MLRKIKSAVSELYGLRNKSVFYIELWRKSWFSYRSTKKTDHRMNWCFVWKNLNSINKIKEMTNRVGGTKVSCPSVSCQYYQ